MTNNHRNISLKSVVLIRLPLKPYYCEGRRRNKELWSDLIGNESLLICNRKKEYLNFDPCTLVKRENPEPDFEEWQDGKKREKIAVFGDQLCWTLGRRVWSIRKNNCAKQHDPVDQIKSRSFTKLLLKWSRDSWSFSCAFLPLSYKQQDLLHTPLWTIGEIRTFFLIKALHPNKIIDTRSHDTSLPNSTPRQSKQINNL